jgi:hypothetical protein
MSKRKSPQPRLSVKRSSKKQRKQMVSALEDDEIVPRAAFRKFELTDEWNGKRRLRGIGKGLSLAKNAPNAVSEVLSLRDDAMGRRVPWVCYYNRAGKMILREKRRRIEPEAAIEDLFLVAQVATAMLANVAEKCPDLCAKIAGKKSEWPVLADMTEKDWRRTISDRVARLKVGEKIEGYLLSARTADENVIRCFATAIYQTLFQTRFDFRRGKSRKIKYQTTKGCPEWAKKTQDLPPFTKENSRAWAKLGEEMLLEQMPDFLNHSELAAKLRSWSQRAVNRSRSGKISPTAIRREAFNDFAKELKNLAPSEMLRSW